MKRNRDLRSPELPVIHRPHKRFSGCIHRSVDLQCPGDLMNKVFIHILGHADKDFFAEGPDLIILIFISSCRNFDLTVLRMAV